MILHLECGTDRYTSLFGMVAGFRVRRVTLELRDTLQIQQMSPMQLQSLREWMSQLAAHMPVGTNPEASLF